MGDVNFKVLVRVGFASIAMLAIKSVNGWRRLGCEEGAYEVGGG